MHVWMPVSAHFYVLLTEFTLSVYFTVILISNMLFSIYLVLVSTNFIRRSQLPMAQRTLRNHWLILQLCTPTIKIITFKTKQEWGLGRGQRHLPKIIKIEWTESLKHNNLLRKLYLSNNYSDCTALMRGTTLVHTRYHCASLHMNHGRF